VLHASRELDCIFPPSSYHWYDHGRLFGRSDDGARSLGAAWAVLPAAYRDPLGRRQRSLSPGSGQGGGEIVPAAHSEFAIGASEVVLHRPDRDLQLDGDGGIGVTHGGE
jgi:hypothetical protein